MENKYKMQHISGTKYGYSVSEDITSQEIFLNLFMFGRIQDNRFLIILNDKTYKTLSENDKAFAEKNNQKGVPPLFAISINNKVPDNQIYLNKRL